MRNFYKFTFLLLLSLHANAQGTFTAVINLNTTKFCTDREIGFSVTSQTMVTGYTWTAFPNKGITIIPNQNNDSVSFIFATPLNYTVSVQLTSDTETATASRVISVSRSAVAAFNASLITTGYPNQLQLTNYSVNYLDSYWTFNDATVDSSFNTIKNYASSGNYKVTLFALGKNGCDDTLSYSFRISDSSAVTLPNVFTPNYDGVNDVFKPITTGISDLNVWIYNRDGVLIANWNKVNGSWDGHTTSGEECHPGSYFVIMAAVGFDGKNYKMKGTLTLLR